MHRFWCVKFIFTHSGCKVKMIKNVYFTNCKQFLREFPLKFRDANFHKVSGASFFPQKNFQIL